MKKSLILLSFLFCTQAMSSTVDSQAIRLYGTPTSENTILNASQTKTLYRTETVNSTCYRTVRDGWELQCRVVPDVVCYDVPGHRPPPPGHSPPPPGHRPPPPGHRPPPPGHRPPPPGGPRPRTIELETLGLEQRVCETRYREYCENVPRYVQQAYSCQKSVQVPYEVHDYNVKNNVTVNVTYPKGNVENVDYCELNLSQHGNSFSTSASCSDLILIPSKSEKIISQGSTVVKNTTLNVKAYSTYKTTAPTASGIKSLKVEGQNVVFNSGDLTTNSNISIKLYVQRRNLIKKDVTLINRVLKANEYTFTKTSDKAGKVSISLSKLFGGIDKSKKHIISVEIKVLDNLEGALNQSSIPSLKASSSITIK